MFVPFDQSNRLRNRQCKSFFNQITFSYRVLFLTSFIFMIANCFSAKLAGYLENIPMMTITKFEYYRLVTAPLATLDGFYGAFSVIMSFWWFLSLFPYHEKKYSSVNLLLQIFIQNFFIQLFYTIVAVLLVRSTYYYETMNNYFYSLGWVPILIVWIFRHTSQDPLNKVSFCFLPFLVQNWHLPWIISIVFLILTTQKLALFIAMLLGAFQFQILNRSIFRPSMCLHHALQKIIPNCIKSRSYFIKVVEAEYNLAVLCGAIEGVVLNEENNNESEKGEREEKEMENFVIVSDNESEQKQLEKASSNDSLKIKNEKL